MTYTPETIGKALAEHIKEKFGTAWGSKKAAARAIGVTRVEISETLYLRRAPSRKVLASMGLKKSIVYVPKEQPCDTSS